MATVTLTVDHNVRGMSVVPEPGCGAGPGHPGLICFCFFSGEVAAAASPPHFALFWFPQNSVTRSAPVNSDSQGRCGARFLTTYDRRFVIKAVSSEDVAEMHNILKKYHQVR